MKLPRDLSRDDLARVLGRFGYLVTRQSGSHMRLTTNQQGERHMTIPRNDALSVGTLAGILSDVSVHLGLSREELAERLFGEGK